MAPARALVLLLLGASLSGCALFSPRPVTKPAAEGANDPSWIERLEEQRAEHSRLESQLATLRSELAAEKVKNSIVSGERKHRRASPADWDIDAASPAATHPATPTRARAREERALRKEKTLPTVRLKPAPTEADEDSDETPSQPLPGDDEETVADSSHEELHRYYEGLERLRAGQLDRALIAFADFLTENPEHVYADRALAHIAEAHERAGEWTAVIQATHRLESGYAHSFSLPLALFRRATAYQALHETAKAQETWRQLLRRFPNEPEAERASKKLAELGVSERPLLLSPKGSDRYSARNSARPRKGRGRRPIPLLQDIP